MTISGTHGLRWVSLALAGLALTFSLACGGGSGGSSSGGAGSSGGQAAAAPPDQQVLKLRTTGEPNTIDPHLTNFSTSTTIEKSLFSTLFTFDPDSLKVVPDLAAELPTADNGGVSKDGLVYTIKLRKDLKWSDGKTLTANDFVYSMKRAMDPKLAGPYTSFYHVIVGAKEYNTALGTKLEPKTTSDADLARLRDAVGVKAKDDYTVEYTLRQTSPSFLQLLAIWTAYPVRQDVVEKFGDKWTEAGNMVSNGPFVLKEWSHNSRLVLVPNENWHRSKTKLSRVEINIIVDDAAAYASYLNDELDEVIVPPANRKEVLSPGSPLNSQMIRFADATSYALIPNVKQAPFDNVKVRQAFGTAVDRKGFIEGVFQGVGIPRTSWIASGQPGFNPELGKQYNFDAVKAKQLLSDAGFPNGQGLPKVTFLFATNDTNRLVGQFLQDQLKKNLNVEVDLEFVDSATYNNRYTRSQFQIVQGGWHMDWPYPDNWLPEFMGTGGSNNQGQYSNPQLDDLFKKAAAEQDDKKRLELYDQAQKLALDDAALVPIYEREQLVLVKPRVKDLKITGLDSTIKGDYNLWRAYIAAQ